MDHVLRKSQRIHSYGGGELEPNHRRLLYVMYSSNSILQMKADMA